MAKDDDAITVQVDDIETITVNVEDNPALAQEDPKPAKKETVRVKPKEDPKPAGPSPEEVLAQAKAFGEQQEAARKAAEATAASERARADAAERARQQAITEAQDYQQRAENSELLVIENSIAAATNELEVQQEAYTRAAESGEFAKMAQIQIKMSKAAAALDRLEDAKNSISTRRTIEQPTEGRVQAPAPQGNPTEQFLSSFSPVAQNWLRMHMDCLPPQHGGNQIKNSQMMQGHYAAIAQNIQEGSPDYFRVIEEHIGVRQPPLKPQTPDADPAPRSHTKVQHAAPPSRDVPDPSTGHPAPRNAREVRLTKDQQDVARMTWPDKTPQEAYGLYARNIIELEAEGKLGRTTH